MSHCSRVAAGILVGRGSFSGLSTSAVILSADAADPSESKDLAAAHPDVLNRLAVLAAQAHEPVREGTFARTDRHARDRRAKFGKHDETDASEMQPKAKKP